MKNLRQLIRSYRNPSSNKSPRRAAQGRSGERTHRRLSTESLERRELLAAGIMEFHNPWNQYDVNNDGAITARDALTVINYIGRGESELSISDGDRMFYDVNGDNEITAADALSVINAIGRGESMENQLVELVLTARQSRVAPGGAADNYNLDLIQEDSNGEINVNVGEIFDIEVSYEDLRSETDRLGAFQLIVDLVTSAPDVLQPILFESQTLIVDQAIKSLSLTERLNTTYTFSIPDSPAGISGDLTFTSGNAQSTTFANAARQALTAFGYSADQYILQTPSQIGEDVGVQIIWNDLALGNLDLPNISVEVNEASGLAEIPTSDGAIPPVITVGTEEQFNPDAIPFSLNTFSRTFKQSSVFPFGEQFYKNNIEGNFDPDTGFSALKGIGGIPAGGGGIPQLIPDIEYPAGLFDAFSFSVVINQPVTDFRIDLFPNADQGAQTESILIYGEDERVPITNDSVIIERPGDVDLLSNGRATLIINAIAAGNQAPVVSQAIAKTFTEDQNTQTVDLLEFSSDPDSDPLTVTGFSVTNDPSSAVTRNGNVVSVNTGAYGALNDGQSQVINLAYTLSDGKGGTVPQTAVITITGITDIIPNQAPVVSQAIAKTFTEDQNTQTVDLLEFSSDPDGDPLTVTGFSVTDDPSSAVTRNGNIVSVNTGAYDALNNGQSQVINLAYTLSDGKGGTVPQTAVITITGITDIVNSPPTVTPLTRSFNEGAANSTVSLLTGASDADSDPLTISTPTLMSGDAKGITIAGTTMTVNPNAYRNLLPGQSEVIKYNYTVTDGKSTPVAQTATITINGVVDDAPTVGTVPDVTTTKGSGPIVIDVLSKASPGGGETQTLSIVSAALSNPAAGTLSTNGTITFTPAAAFEGDVVINYVISDGTSNANGSVDVSVVNFVPSVIGGSVFIDRIENMRQVLDGATPFRDGMKDADEQGLGGVPIKLMGNGMSFTAITDINGTYQFQNVAPGSYQVVYDAPSSVILGGPSMMSVTVGAAGGVTEEHMNVALLGLTPGATSAVDILARTYLNSSAQISLLSNGGREGAVVSFDSSGKSNFIMAGEGFDGVKYADVRMVNGSDQDVALLTVMKENGEIMQAHVGKDQAVASGDGTTMRFFGGMFDFDFQQISQNASSYDDFQNAIDQILSDD